MADGGGERMLTPTDVAQTVGVSYEAVRNWVATGRMRAIKVGGRYRIPESEIREFLNYSEGTRDETSDPAPGDPPAPGVFGEDRPLIVPERLGRE